MEKYLRRTVEFLFIYYLPRDFKDGNVVRLSRCGDMVLPPTLIRNGEDAHNLVSLLLQEPVHVRGEDGLTDNGDFHLVL